MIYLLFMVIFHSYVSLPEVYSMWLSGSKHDEIYGGTNLVPYVWPYELWVIAYEPQTTHICKAFFSSSIIEIRKQFTTWTATRNRNRFGNDGEFSTAHGGKNYEGRHEAQVVGEHGDFIARMERLTWTWMVFAIDLVIMVNPWRWYLYSGVGPRISQQLHTRLPGSHRKP